MAEVFSMAEVMKTFDLGRNTLRLYEEMGLLSGLTRTDSGYRQFTKKHMEDLRFILEAKKVGFALGEIKDLLTEVREKRRVTCSTVSREIKVKISAIEDQIHALNEKKAILTNFLSTCALSDADSPCNVTSKGFLNAECCE